MLVVMQQAAGKGEHLRGHVDDGAVAQHRAAHAHTVHIGAVGGAQVLQLVLAVLVDDLAVVARDAVADQLDVAVVTAADEHPLFALDVDLAQDGGVGLFLPGAGGAALHGADFLDAESDLLR